MTVKKVSFQVEIPKQRTVLVLCYFVFRCFRQFAILWLCMSKFVRAKDVMVTVYDWSGARQRAQMIAPPVVCPFTRTLGS